MMGLVQNRLIYYVEAVRRLVRVPGESGGAAEMAEETSQELEEMQEAELREYRTSLPLQLEVEAVTRLLAGEKLSESRCLDVSAGDGMVSRVLRELGGAWCTLVESERAGERVSVMTGSAPERFGSDGSLPYEDKAFDVVVVSSGVMARAADDQRLMAGCHRVLRDGGVFVTCSSRVKNLGLIARMRRMMGVTAGDRGLPREGYSEKQPVEPGTLDLIQWSNCTKKVMM